MKTIQVEQTAYVGDMWGWQVKVQGRTARSGLAKGRKGAWKAANKAAKRLS
jgi:hypothetical protein